MRISGRRGPGCTGGAGRGLPEGAKERTAVASRFAPSLRGFPSLPTPLSLLDVLP